MQVLRHQVGAPAGEDSLMLEERGEANFVALGRTKDWAFTTLNVNSKTSSEVRPKSALLAKFAFLANFPPLCKTCLDWPTLPFSAKFAQ